MRIQRRGVRVATRRTLIPMTIALLLGMSGWQAPVSAQSGPFLTVRPTHGPGGTPVRVKGYVLTGTCQSSPRITIAFTDAATQFTDLRTVSGGKINLVTKIPTGAALGTGVVSAWRDDGKAPFCHVSNVAHALFKVT